MAVISNAEALKIGMDIAEASKPMLAPVEAVLIRENGALDEAAMRAEIQRRCAEQVEAYGYSSMEFHARHVAQEAASQQWRDHVQPAIDAEWTAAERERYDALWAAHRAGGLANYAEDHSRSWELAGAIRQAVYRRAVAKFHARLACEECALCVSGEPPAQHIVYDGERVPVCERCCERGMAAPREFAASIDARMAR